MPSIGEIADWASIFGFLLTLANALALVWIVRRTQFNLTADNIIARVEVIRSDLSKHLSYDNSNRAQLLELATRCGAALKGMRRMVDRQSRDTIDECVRSAESLVKSVSSGVTGGAVENTIGNLYAKLAGVSEDLASLRDRRRAGL
jgi:hypothetical protein